MTDIEDQMRRLRFAFSDPQFGPDLQRELFKRYQELHAQRDAKLVKELEKKWGLK